MIEMASVLTGLLPLFFLIWLAKTIKKRFSSSGDAKPIQQAPAQYTWPELGDYNCDIVGEGFYQPTLQKLAGEHGEDSAEVYTTAVLIPYSTNPHDDKAVRIDIGGAPVGHLSRDDARIFRRRLNSKKLGTAPTRCGALIMGGFTNRQGKVASYGVRLDIKPFD